MANSIATKQNSLWSLRLLLTQRELYGRAKLASAAQLILTVVIPALLIAAQVSRPHLKLLAALYGLVASIVDFAFIDAIKTHFRRQAALTQEAFDCEVLGLPWSELIAGKRPDNEDVIIASEEDSRFAPIRDWYAPDVAAVSLPTGRIICQRSNCWWDAKLRRWYRWLLVGFVVLALLSISLVSIAANQTMPDFILGFLAPLLPMALWSIREARTQVEAADRADRLKSFGDGLWTSTKAGTLSDDDATTRSRDFQSAIFSHRRQSPLVFDWVHNRLKGRFEAQMRASVRQMLDELNSSTH